MRGAFYATLLVLLLIVLFKGIKITINDHTYLIHVDEIEEVKP